MTDYARLVEELTRQEAELRFPHFDHAVAWEIGSRLALRALQRGLPIAIEIMQGAERLFFYAAPGATPDNVEWIRRKRAVVERFHHSTMLMRMSSEGKGTSFHEKYLLDEREFAVHGGAFPLFVQSAGFVGTITVSGLPQTEDHALIVTTLRDYLSRAHLDGGGPDEPAPPASPAR
ncbi:Uncharacterized protein, UPF0303 family [Faunimonas pinastri]|uniref:UPF0303 protein SAMN05216548_107201 n=1 Tax=Faunimonas pinastri TaxID=1855383 RepID=A0A1H9ISS8_9HYPH|nr:heme-degrading domain-containing protein [Faunimonas pinastri]SEQ77821.1 Uncharacterized protein, UPF0303 family [Faunimonas pinastri]